MDGTDAVRIAPGVLTDALGDLTASGAATQDVAEAVAQVLARAAEVFGVTGVGLMLLDAEEQELRYAAATDVHAEELEAAQIATGEGPCVDAYVLGRVVATTDVRDDDRWPLLRERRAVRSIGAVLGVPVRVSLEPIGSLNAYSQEPKEWDESERTALIAFGDLLATRLESAVWARRHGEASELADQLQRALDTRVAIERAIGYLMGRYDLGPVAAFNALRGTARSNREKVADLAARVLDGGEVPELEAALGGQRAR